MKKDKGKDKKKGFPHHNFLPPRPSNLKKLLDEKKKGAKGWKKYEQEDQE